MKNYYKSGEIILIPFPFTDLSDTKVRPALVLIDQFDRDVLLVPISTIFNTPKSVLNIPTKHYIGDALPVLSCVSFLKLFTLDSQLIIKRVSFLDIFFMRKLKKVLFQYIGSE